MRRRKSMIKINKKLVALGLAMALAVSAASVQAAEALKIGVVNFKYCVENSKLGKEEQANFEGIKKKMEEVLEQKEKALTEIAGKFNDPDYLDTLSAEAEAD